MMIRTVVLGGVLCAALALVGCARTNKDNASQGPPDASGGNTTPVGSAPNDNRPNLPVHKTPQECFEALAAADAKGDHKTYVACLAPEYQRKLAGEAALLTILKPDRPLGGKEAEAAEKFAKPLREAAAKHGLTEEVTKDITLGNDPNDQEKARQALLARIKDPAAFVVDTLAATDKAFGGRAEKQYTQTLIDVKIAGDRATGAAVIKYSFSEEKKPVSFVKIDGGWRAVAEPGVTADRPRD